MVDNLLPNTNWQLFTQLGPQQCAMNHQGTGTQANISISSFDPSNNNPNFYTPNTEQIEVGALVYVNLGIPAFGNGLTALRVNRVVPNSLFQSKLPFGIKSPTRSFAATALPVSVVDNEGKFEAGPDGWKKSASMVLWPDDFSTNACLGAKRVLGLRKQTSGAETFFWPCPKGDIRKFAGRTITFGALVRQKVQSGAGTWRLRATDNAGTSDSGKGKGILFNDPIYGGFEFRSVTRTVPANATDFTLGLSAEGNTGDVYYLALPTAAFRSSMTRDDCGTNAQETILATNHWNPPLLTPLAITFPADQFPGSDPKGPLYGFSSQDLEALSNGVVHHTVKAVKAKIELKCPVAGTNLMCGSAIDPSALTFGPQAISQVANVRSVGAGWWPLDPNGCVALFVDTRGATITNATFDFDWVLA